MTDLQEANTVKLEEEKLRVGLTESPAEDGLFATFYDDGDLKSLQVYQEGRPVGPGLQLASEQRRGSVCETMAFEEDEAESHVHFEDWVWRVIRDLEDRVLFVQRCGFCEKAATEVLSLIAGPTTSICNECIAICNEVLREQELRT